jgi:DNA-binding GntR family transcriptional regulator
MSQTPPSLVVHADTPALALQRSAAPPRQKEPSAMEQALQRMRRMVLEGKLSPGEQIRQQEMAELLGVSRVPLREALNVLADQGLLQHRPHSGYFVSKRSPEEVRQIRRMLELLETELLASIQWPSAAVLKQLRQQNEQMRSATQAHDWIGLMQLNRDFHFQIFGLSPDRLILDELKRLFTLADPLIAQKLANPASAMRTLTEHDAILDALERADRDACQARMADHRDSSNPMPSAPAARVQTA